MSVIQSGPSLVIRGELLQRSVEIRLGEVSSKVERIRAAWLILFEGVSQLSGAFMSLARPSYPLFVVDSTLFFGSEFCLFCWRRLDDRLLDFRFTAALLRRFWRRSSHILVLCAVHLLVFVPPFRVFLLDTGLDHCLLLLSRFFPGRVLSRISISL